MPSLGFQCYAEVFITISTDGNTNLTRLTPASDYCLGAALVAPADVPIVRFFRLGIARAEALQRPAALDCNGDHRSIQYMDVSMFISERNIEIDRLEIYRSGRASSIVRVFSATVVRLQR